MCSHHVVSVEVFFLTVTAAVVRPSERRFLRLLFQHSLLRLLLFLLFRSHTSILLLCSLQLSRRGYLELRSCKSRLRCVCLCYFPIAAPHCWRLILTPRSGPFGRVRRSRRRLFKRCGWHLAGKPKGRSLDSRYCFAWRLTARGRDPTGSGTSMLAYRFATMLLEFPAFFVHCVTTDVDSPEQQSLRTPPEAFRSLLFQTETAAPFLLHICPRPHHPA